jgi:lipopolysaccharide transport system permease protein
MRHESLVIEAGRTEAHYWRDLWRYRELFGFLAWRDVLVRYKQTVVGIAWAVMRPLLTTLILVFAFGKIAGLSSHGVPYPILVLAGNIPWVFFSSALGESSQSLIGNSNLISKIYFPRMILPASAIIVALIDCLICLGILPFFMAAYGYWPTWRLFTLPVFILLALIAALGPGLLVTALNVKYRDFRYIVPFIMQFGLYVSPVGFSSSVIGEKFGPTWQMVYSLNPMVGVIDGFRWAVCQSAPVHLPSFFISTALSFIMLAWGIRYFRKTERTFADVI